jgi:hypothetical protein
MLKNNDNNRLNNKYLNFNDSFKLNVKQLRESRNSKTL